eukprot:scaffold176099_cov21-Tisochrysis_lutea.AAC.1
MSAYFAHSLPHVYLGFGKGRSQLTTPWRTRRLNQAHQSLTSSYLLPIRMLQDPPIRQKSTQ